MTRQPGSFLIRLERGGQGSITAIRTGEHVEFASLDELLHAIERLSPEGPAEQRQEGST